MTTNGDFPAFAAAHGDGDFQTGLTKRELFAAMAMQGSVASDRYGVTAIDIHAQFAVKQADALIAELNKETTP